jgi:hypothetical protein
MSEPNTQSILHLLNSITIIKNKYDDIAKITGENFNIFKILGLTTNEVRTHSAFLAELLNPIGNHGQGDLFLKSFLKQFELEFETKNAIIEIEKHTGFINEDYTQGGYIDIIISNGKKAIIIENKIYAGDQSMQLVRYSNYSKKVYGPNNFHLLYLTLNGKDASDASKGQLTLNSDYHLISYESDILDWLELCKKESVSLPILRETILQYINLIKYLTNQSTNNKMSDEISKLLIKGDNFKTAEIIKIEFENTIKFMELEFRTALSNKLKDILVDVKISDFIVKFELEEDQGGLYYGALIRKNGEKIKPSAEPNTFDSIISNLKKHSDTTFRINCNDTFLGWINVLGDGIKYSNLSNNDKLLYHTDLDERLKIIHSKCQSMFNLIK